MPAAPDQVPILRSAAAGYAFLRAYGLALAPYGFAAAIAGAAAGVCAPLGVGPAPPPTTLVPFGPFYLMAPPLLQQAAMAMGVWFPGVGVAFLALAAAMIAYLVQLSVAHRLAAGAAAPPEPIAGSVARLAGAFGGLFFLFAVLMTVVGLALAFAIAGVLESLGVNQAELAAAQADPQAAVALAERAVAAGGAAILAPLLAAVVLVLWLMTRLALAIPASVRARRALVFATWNWTRGSALRIFAAASLVYLPLMAMAYLVSALAAAALGQPTSPSEAFTLNLAIALPQTLLVVPAMAGMSHFLYLGLKPPDAP